MPTGQEFSQGLRDIIDYCEKTNREVVDEIDGETGDGGSVSGYLIRHGNHDVITVGSPEWDFFRVEYQYSILSDIIQRQASNDNGELPEGFEPSQGHVEAAQNRVESIFEEEKSEEEIAQLRYNLIQMLSSPESGYKLLPPNGPYIHGFEIQRRMFVYEEKFSPSDFNRAIQTVVSQGIPVKKFFQLSFNLFGPQMESSEGSTAQSESSTEDIRGFQ